ncbi:MAG: hypothetical protein LBT25_08710 [Candidatus Symbiothrix sp.]|jgi:hypothetical protein|nr:hypothetical protein [Candidatus Symbiothrix sp.]
MKTKYLFIVVLLLSAGNFSCSKEEDIDMSQIDFSNIEELYKQPLPVIQKCVQGKWKVYSQCGGVVGCVYPENSFREYSDNQMIWNNEQGNIYTRTYSWKKKLVEVSDKKVITYIRWFDGVDETAQAGEYFLSIKNDTLFANSCQLTSEESIFRTTMVRVK